MAKVGRNLQWHLAKLEPHVTRDDISLSRIHYALRADGRIIQRIVLLQLNAAHQKDLGWKLFATKTKPADLYAELIERDFKDVGVD